MAKVKSLVTHEWTHTPPNDHTWNYAQVKMHKSESLLRLLLLFVRSHVALPSAAYDYVRYLVYNKYIYYCTMRCIDMVQNISYHHGDVWSLRNESFDRRNWYSSRLIYNLQYIFLIFSNLSNMHFIRSKSNLFHYNFARNRSLNKRMKLWLWNWNVLNDETISPCTFHHLLPTAINLRNGWQ